MPDIIEINGEKIGRGEKKELDLKIARLPTYTNIDLPVRVIRAKEPGPVVLLTGGLHGDEINGIEIVRSLLANKYLNLEKGSIIAIPLMNVYGFIQNARGVPDGKDINRSFPGSKSGSLAKLVAYTIMNQIIPKIDFGIDFHTGGSSRSNYPQIRCVLDIEKNLELAKAFAPPIILHSPLIDKSFRKAAYKKRKHILVYETGESMRFDENGIQEGINGTLRLLKHLGMIDEAPEPHHPEIYEKSDWARASFAGLYHAKVKLGDYVEKGMILGFITDPYGNEKKKVKSRFDGRIIGINNCPVVHKGDAILHIATQRRQ
ncbi:succinylglutamate desuccinylase/aspartoacylase family protein [Rhodohalobacter sp. 614A]|uniref:succinylglutamate desuccinylase/aspartoacylase family protein n=1 Tax=Rhodohalobacter sp. 614A TaxID=2908649 RepID=UPI001F46FBB9|nr:succinylglutamate desuccinylase/aspartoacylase family protein [Rhodohalobacter sp. 614A]